MHEEPRVNLYTPDEPPPVDDERLLSVPDTGRVLGGITRPEVYKLLKTGDLESVRIGRRRLVTTASIDAYVERLREAAAAARAGAA